MIQGRLYTAQRAPELLPVGRDAVNRQICVIFRPGDDRLRSSNDAGILKLERDLKLRRLAVSETTRLLLYDVAEGEAQVDRIVASLLSESNLALIESAERNRLVRKLVKPNDPFFAEQWAWRRLGAHMAWDRVATGAAPIIVAIVDSGAADNHEDLKPRLWRNTAETQHGPNCIDDDANGVIDDFFGARFTVSPADGDVWDDDDHGTLLAGTIGAVSNNLIGIAGAANVQLMPVKFFGQQVWPSAGLGALAIGYAADMGAKVINLSWDVGYSTAALRQAIAYAGTKGALVVVAAGNDSSDNDVHPNWPANHGDQPHVVTVMAIDKSDDRASFSNYGRTTVHVAAPGVDILSTAPYLTPPSAGSTIAIGYRSYGGTSAATAHVAGLAALIRLQNPSWTPADVKSHLRVDTAAEDILISALITTSRLQIEASKRHRISSDPSPRGRDYAVPRVEGKEGGRRVARRSLGIGPGERKCIVGRVGPQVQHRIPTICGRPGAVEAEYRDGID